MENTDIRHYEAEYLHVRHYQYDGRIYLVATEGNINNRVTERNIQASRIIQPPARTAHRRKQENRQNC